jgi:phosphoinositide-3-kinase regulatory subunit 4
MGQGYSMTTLSAASASIDTPELADLVHEKTLASARFMKSMRARHQNGYVFVKAIMKPYATFEVQEYVKRITEERNNLADIPNALGYQRIVDVGSGGFLVRQYIFNSVYDRMSTRPFLEDIEKKWMVYQLLCAVRDCHARNVYHGDIKTENLLVTSWNWVYLTDFSSSFKPTNLPEDNPADFSFYFDTSARRTCYLAPERFGTASGSQNAQVEMNWSMDIFSVGCVIAEIFLEGPIFSLSQIFKYRSGEYSPEHTHLNKIDDPEVREMILSMIQLDPEKRYSAEQYLSIYRSTIFPEYFYSFLHQYMLDLTTSSSRAPVILELSGQGEADDRIDRVHYDFEKISYFLGYKSSSATKPNINQGQQNTPDTSRAKQKRAMYHESNLEDGTLLFMNIVVSSIRNTSKASARLKACELLVAFATHLSDEAKLDRVLPYIVGLLQDKSDAVRVASLKAMTSIFQMVQVVSPINAYIFPEYIFPKLKDFIPNAKREPSTLIKATYASCLAPLAEASSRVLDMVQAIRADGRLPALSENEWGPETSFHGLYDVARMELIPHFEEATKALITDPDASVRRAFLGSVSRLCVFFGSSKASDIILSHLNTYLNDKDWILRCTFYDTLVGVAAYVGSASLEKFILPIMIQSLCDRENFVVEKVFRSLARMADLGLLSRSTTWSLVSIAVRFLIHPSMWIRESVVQFIIAASKYASKADVYCIMLPMVQPFLKSPVADISEVSVLEHLKKPLAKSIVEAAVAWASKYNTSTFWTAASRDGVFTLPETDSPASSPLQARRILTKIPPSQRNTDDSAQLEMLRRLGLTSEDETKLLALREYIFRLAHSRNEDEDTHKIMLGGIIKLNELNVRPQTVFFGMEEPNKAAQETGIATPRSNGGGPHTLTDALLDASTTIEDASYRRRSSLQPTSRETNLSQQAKNMDTVKPPTPSKLTTGPVSTPAINVQTVAIEPGLKDGSSGYGSSPSELDKASLRRASTRAIRPRGSAINLLGRTDTAKATAATATTSENAFGKLDVTSRRSTERPLLAGSESEKPEYEVLLPTHSYAGADPNVLRLLSHHFQETFSPDVHAFQGSMTAPIGSKEPIRKATDQNTVGASNAQETGPKYPEEAWRPSGHLLAMYTEHTAAINRVLPAPDHAFFVTASDDGTCRIWDSLRLEKNLTTRSRHVYRHSVKAKVKTLCFVEDTHTFVSAADDGSIHAVRINSKEEASGVKYERPAVVRQYQLPPPTKKGDSQEYILWMSHHRTTVGPSQSLLLAATTHSRIIAIDLKSSSLRISYELINPPHHGTPITFTTDSKHQWLLLGTSHGILDLWDLRFQLRLKSIGLPTSTRVDRLAIHTGIERGHSVLVSSGGEISLWDLESMSCKEVYRPSSTTANTKPYTPWFPDDEPTDKILSRMAKSDRPDGPIPLSYLPITAMDLTSDFLHNSDKPNRPTRIPLLITGGADRTLRYWYLPSITQSSIISGPALNTEDGTSITQKIRYEETYPLSASAGAQIAVWTEHLPDAGTGAGVGAGPAGSPSGSSARTTPRSTPSGSSKRSATNSEREGLKAAAAEKAKPPRNVVISGAQSRLLRTHVDAITDCFVLRRPYGVVVSVDRMGGVYVFQ